MAKRKLLTFLNEYQYIFILFTFYSIISLTLIFSIDDFAWSTSLGIERFNSNFADYNGRYIGNYIVLLITRFPLIRMLIYGVINTGIVFFMYNILEKKINYYFIFILTLLLPIDLYRQTYGWLSGFSNYNVPIFFVLFLIYLFLKTNKSVWNILLTFVISINVQLYLENISIVNIVIALSIFIWAMVASRDNVIWSISAFVGSVIGGIIMFSNTAYSSNSTNRGISNIDFNFMWKNYITQWSELFFKTNIALIILLCIGLILITKKNKMNFLTNCTVIIYFIFRNILKIQWQVLPTKWLYFEGALVAFIIIYVFVMVIKSNELKKNNKRNFIIFFLLAGLYSGPFLLLQIDDQAFIASRNVYGSYILFLLSFLQLYIPTFENFSSETKRMISLIIKRLGLSLMLVFVMLSGINKVYDMKRMDYTQQQISNGATTVKIQRLPFEQLSLPWALSEDSRFINPFKEYYDIPKEVKIYPQTIKNKFN